MAAVNQIEGGNFTDSVGNVLANGYLLFELNQDGTTNNGTSDLWVCAGYVIKVPLDDTGNVITDPAYSLWPNNVITPVNTSVGSYYYMSAYTSGGELVWGPIAVQILSTPSPFVLGALVP